MYRKINEGFYGEDKKEEIKIIEINEEYMKDRLLWVPTVTDRFIQQAIERDIASLEKKEIDRYVSRW